MNAMISMTHFAFISVLLAVTGPLERDMKDREKLEEQTIGYIAKTIPFYESLSGEKLTNLLQLFTTMTNGNLAYPYWHERCFQKFHKKNAGFTNSVLEKYVLLGPGIYLVKPLTELVIISAQPYQNREKKLERAIIYKTKEGLTSGSYLEEHIQALFREAGRQIPAATPLPRPPPAPLPAPKQRFPGEPPKWVMYMDLPFTRLAEMIGLGQRYGPVLRNIAALLLVAGGSSAAWSMWRQSRRRNEDGKHD